MTHRFKTLAAASAIALMVSWAGLALAQTSPDAPDLDVVMAGHGKVRLTVTAGPTGAPDGFTVWWMRASRFDQLGRVWPATITPDVRWATFDGLATLNTWGADERSFRLGSSEALDVEIGDLFDESGVSGNVASELTDNVEYVFCVFANGSTPGDYSPLSVTVAEGTTPLGQNCTFTQGYWKNHPGAWPVGSLMLGTVSYTQAEMLTIYAQPVAGNGLIQLAHQLIAAKLNIANGANPVSISATIAAADALIGGLVVPTIGSGTLPTSATSTLTQALDDFNSGDTGPGHCGNTPTRASTWGAVKGIYR